MIAKSKDDVKGKYNPKQWEREILERERNTKKQTDEEIEVKYFLKLTRKYLLKDCEGLSVNAILLKQAIDLHINKKTAEARVGKKILLPLAHIKSTSLKKLAKN